MASVPQERSTSSRPCAKQRTRISCNQFYSYRLHPRSSDDHIFRCGKLFQRYVVDAFVKVESNNLDFLRFNQKQLRVETYTGVKSYVAHLKTRVAGDQPVVVGTPVILPSSYHVCNSFVYFKYFYFVSNYFKYILSGDRGLSTSIIKMP